MLTWVQPIKLSLGIISMQTRSKLKQALKGVFNCCKLEFGFKCYTRLSRSFCYKDPMPKDLIFAVVYKFQCSLYSETYRQRYQKLRYKIWGTYQCVISYWKEDETIKKHFCL